MISRIASILALLAIAHGFTVMPASRMMGDIDVIMNKADDCAEGECSVDEVGELIDILKVQQKDLSNRIQEIKKMRATLQTMNDSDSERAVDEIRETVRAIYRVFQLGDKASGNDYPSLSRPTGWSGDVGNGPSDAYDVLPPKKFSP